MFVSNRKFAHFLCLAVALLTLSSCSDSNSLDPDSSETPSDDQPMQQPMQQTVQVTSDTGDSDSNDTDSSNTESSDTASSNTDSSDADSNDSDSAESTTIESNSTDSGSTEDSEPLVFPTYGGVLDVSNGVDYDLTDLLENYGLDRVEIASLSGDGSSILLKGRKIELNENSYLLLDTATRETTELIRQIAANTEVIFDKNNDLIVVSANDCETPSYVSEVPVPLILSDIIPAGRCIFPGTDLTLSDNGNVILFYTYDQNFTTEYAYQTNRLHAYTLDTATLQTWTDPVITPDQITVGSRNGAIPEQRFWSFSSDGRLLYTPIWWEGQNEDVTVQYVGAVLWNTRTGDMQARAVTQDQRNCVPTSKVSCSPTYQHVMSTDGTVQYSHKPTEKETNLASPFTNFVRDTVRTETDAPSEISILAMQNSFYLATNHNGSHVFFNDGRRNDSMFGNALFQHASGKVVSIDPALRECSIDSITGEGDTSEFACKYRQWPFTVENNAMSFSTNGKTLLMRSISRFTLDEPREQALTGFMLDIDTGKLIEMPDGYSVHQNRISADAKILLGRSTVFPYNVLTLVTRP